MRTLTGVRYWQTEPMRIDKPAARIHGVSIRRSDNYTGPSLKSIKRNVSQSNVTWPNKSDVATVTVFGNLYEEKNMQIYVEKCLSSCLSSCPTDSSSHFCPKNSVCHRQRSHRVFVMRKKNTMIVSPPDRDFSWLQKTASTCKWESQTASSLLMLIMLLYHLEWKT